MKPADLRNATWAEVQDHLTEDLIRVHAAWLEHGPGTTRQVADRSGISLLTLRPRTTDLGDIGMVKLIGRSGTEGIYAYVSPEEAEMAWDGQRSEVRGQTAADSEQLSASSLKPSAHEVARQVNTLPMRDQVSIAAAIMARAGHAKKHAAGVNRQQQELFA